MVSDNLKKKNHITIGSMITIKEFSEKTGVALPDIMTIMMQNGIMG